MSLNHLTTSVDYLEKQYLNIGCNDIKCSSIYVADSQIKGCISGTYTPGMEIHDGSTTTNLQALYTIIGNDDNAILNVSLKCVLVVGSSSTFYAIGITFPIGYKVRSEISSVVGNIHSKNGNDDNYSAYITLATVGQERLVVLFDTDTAAKQIPIGLGQNYVNCTFTVAVKKV